ncbi:MAG TPA: 2-oxo-4-hydroxy-4-carboxy-5-ureidoimidazoline decarboxylase [Stellaceae bacterium]|nr:2-oxo-4-hydroxy-4-carboxy-5-ureidoimidazoline decarboxylase [Stellaceae bacterium]
MPSLDALNALDRAGFVAVLGPLFEHSPWIAEATWERRPFTTIGALHDALVATVTGATDTAQLALIRAHPDLAGKAARANTLTAESTREQAGAGLDQLTAEEYALFQRLNQAYCEKFGFPFIICVRHHDKTSILAEFQRRLDLDPLAERRQALREIGEIARIRLLDFCRQT